MLLLSWGKRLKHGKRNVRPNLEKALDSFLKASAKGSALAMVDAGLVYWQMGLKDKAVALYLNAAELGHPAGMCNLGISYLQGIFIFNDKFLFKFQSLALKPFCLGFPDAFMLMT